MGDGRPPVVFVVPGSLAQRTGGYGYDRRIIAELRMAGRDVTVAELDGRFPQCDAEAERAAAIALKAAPAESVTVIDGLALPAFRRTFPDTSRLRAVLLVHHPLSLESGLADRERARLTALEQALLPRAAGIVTTSPATAQAVSALGVARDAISVVRPGTDPAPLAKGSPDNTCNLLCVAALIPRKGHLLLIDALAACTDLTWRLHCLGSPDRDPATAAEVRARIEQYGFSDRVILAGEGSDPALAAAYTAADIFVLASELEGYGMAFAEALAHGLPVVGSGAGAVRETVPESAGLIVPVGDCAALATALRRVMTDDTLRAGLAAGARAAARNLPTWADAGRTFAAALDRISVSK